jgi:hypothetical protein
MNNKYNNMKFRNLSTYLISVIIVCVTGCAAVEQGLSYIPIGLGLFRSPVTIKTHWGENGPLTDDEKCILEATSNNLNPDNQNSDVLESLSKLSDEECHSQVQSYEVSNSNKTSPYDNLDELHNPHNNTLVFIAISGGGARAAALAEAVFTHLERKYNYLKNRLKSSNFYFPSLLNSVHAISTVSGGSLYAYRVARYKTQLENEKIAVTQLIDNLKDSDKASDAVQSLHKIDFTLKNISCNNPHKTIARLRQINETYSDSFSSAAANEYEQVLNSYINNELIPLEDRLLECIGESGLGISGLSLSKQGLYSSWFYMSPFNLFIGPLVTFLTDVPYLTVLAGTLNGSTSLVTGIDPDYGRIGKIRQIYDPSLFKLSYLTKTPRFFFNATALETGFPFVFTQRLLQLPLKSPLLNKTVKLDEDTQQSTKEDHLRRPLGSLATLEDLNSSPSDTPLAFAAIASAAFPLGFEPLALNKYGYDPVEERVYKSTEKLHVADGGLYDNAGLSTLSELFESITTVRSKSHNRGQKPTLILLSINADADEYDSFFANKIPEEAGFLDDIPFEINAPLRYGALGVDSLSLIHYINKRRAEQIAVGNIQKIKDIVCGKISSSDATSQSAEIMNSSSNDNSCKDEKINFLYFPVSLAQLSSLDRNRIPDPSDLYSRLKKIPTNFTISDDDKLVLHQAADLILSWKQENNTLKTGENTLWKDGVEKIESCEELLKIHKPDFTKLDEAFAFSVLCASKIKIN